jgi:hypothetical protein
MIMVPTVDVIKQKPPTFSVQSNWRWFDDKCGHPPWQ